jgi:hypothetical protein
VVLVLVAVLAGVGLLTRSPGHPAADGPPAVASAFVSAPGAESDAWYCVGQTTASGQAGVGHLVLTNTRATPVSGTIASVTDTGAHESTPVVVPARTTMVPPLAAPASGTWVAQDVILSGGGVAVSQSVHGPSGWSEAPCQSSTGQTWYFPAGVTSGSDSLFITLFNPTSTPEVVDMTFVTPSGIDHPINFQGIVLQPDQVLADDVGSYVQDQPVVATVVTARTGRMVAAELQELGGGSNGLAIEPGSPGAQRRWVIPQSEEVAHGTSHVVIFNPGTTTERVTVRVRLPSGPVAPLVQRVAPDSVWDLVTSAETRILKSDPYSAVITATGGAGVVVGRLVRAPAAADSPQAGEAGSLDTLSATSPVQQWVVPPPGTLAAPAVAGAQPARLALTNDSSSARHFTVSVLAPSGARTLATGTVGAGLTVTLDATVLARARLDPILIEAGGRLAITEDVGPTGSLGVVTMPAIPLG